MFKQKQNFDSLNLMILFLGFLLALPALANSQGIVLHHFFISQDTGSPVYLSADLPDVGGMDLESLSSSWWRLEQLAPGERLLLVKQGDAYDQSTPFQLAGFKLHSRGRLPDQASCLLSTAFPALFPSIDIDFHGDPIEIHTLQGAINPRCSQIKSLDGKAIPFGSAADTKSWPGDLLLIEVPALKHSDQESNTRRFGGAGVSNPSNLKELLSGYYNGGSGPWFDFKPGWGGSNLMDISVAYSLLPTAREKHEGDQPVLVLGSEESVSIEVTDTQGHQWRRLYTMDEARELLEGTDDGDELLFRLQGGSNLMNKAVMEKGLSKMCRESLKKIEHSVPGIISYPTGKNQQANGDAPTSESAGQSSESGNSDQTTGATGSKTPVGMGAGNGGGDREDNEQLEASEAAEVGVIGETYTYSFMDESGEKHTVNLVSRDPKIQGYQCSVCLDISNKASTFCNFHIGCEECFGLLITSECPLCRRGTGVLSRLGFAEMQINQFEVYCPNKQAGCKETPEIGSLSNHYKSCRFTKVKSCNLGCEEGAKPVAVVNLVPAGHTEPQPDRQQCHHYRRSGLLRVHNGGSIDALLRVFEEGELQYLASRIRQNYNGREHALFCNKIKRLTENRNAPLDNEEKHRFEPFIKHLSEVVYFFDCISHSTCIDSLTSSGLLNPSSLSSVRTSQQHLLESLLAAIQSQTLRRRGRQTSLDTEAVITQLWSLARLVERKVLAPRRAYLVVAQLLPQVQNHQAELSTRQITNQLWVLAKLVEHKALSAREACPVVTALLPQVHNHRAQCHTRQITDQLWALTRLVEYEALSAKEACPVVTALLPQVQNHRAQFNTRQITGQLQVLKKLVELEVLTEQQASPTVTALLP